MWRNSGQKRVFHRFFPGKDMFFILPQRFSTAVFSDMPVFPDFFSFFYGHVFLRLRNFVENFFTYPVNSNKIVLLFTP